MKNILLCCAVLSLLACACWGAQQPAPQQAGGQVQRFVVVHSIHFVAGTETLTNTDAHCSIETASGAASMDCHPGAATAKNYYHYNAALIVDDKGMGYVIACRNSLIAFWCKEFGAHTVILGNMAPANLAIPDGDKVHDYAVLTSGYVGLAAVGAPPQAAAPAAAAAAPSPVPAPAPVAAPPSRSASAPAAIASKSVDNSSKVSGDPSAACVSSTGACVSFLSEPSGADIYVDGKFAGNTPSILILSAGSHEIRVENGNRKPWTRTLEISAGSTITVRATFEAPSADK